ncbi:MAG TPA: beta-propeller fold lactonase family protein, partial [Capillimicrobium sp.]|nr:beta-propeller fold lactonase family protein [Capillimicrobium sp.]
MSSRTASRLRAAVTAALGLALLATAPAASAAPGDRGQRAAEATGALTQLPGARGCVADRSGRLAGRRCAAARGLGGPAPFMGSNALAISPDGRHVYVASSSSDAIAVFARNARTGVLTQPDGAAGCVAAGGAEGCAPAVGLDGPNSVTVSPDGATVYATARGSSSVAAFARDASTGGLTQVADGCLAASAVDGCRPGRALAGADAVAVSPDGRNVYVAAFHGNAIAVLARDAATGALTQAAGAAGCVAADAADGCAPALALTAPEGLAVSPDGSTVHVASALANAVLTFSRDAGTGALTQLGDGAGCLAAGLVAGCGPARALLGPNSVAVTPDGS